MDPLEGTTPWMDSVKMTLPRRIIQLAVRNDRLVALCNDGTVWDLVKYGQEWQQVRSIPQP